MKKYTAKQIIERSLNLADISNTDFLTHTENTQYLNDAWRTVFEWLISKGDKQFVKEVELSSSAMGQYTEYELPEDFYQMLSLRSPSGGLIPRKAESESDYSASYDIVNDRLRLYGVSATKLILTYYMNPIWITYPDRDIEVESLSSDDILSSYNNSILYAVDDSLFVKNVVTGEVIAEITEATFTENSEFVLANGHLAIKNDDVWTVYGYSGNVITTVSNVAYAFVISSTVCFSLTDGDVVSIAGNVIIESDEPLNILCGKDVNDYFYVNEAGYLTHYKDGEDTVYTYLTGITKVVYNDDYYTLSTGTFVYTTEDFSSLTIVDIPGIIKAVLKYGVLYYNGFYTVKSTVEDTEFNFPNDLYFSLLACDLALRYCMKMNANTDGLNNLYTNMQTTFMNTLSQAADYTRIKNVYGRGF